MDYAKFEDIVSQAGNVFATWDENMKDFTNVAREVSRKRSERFISIKVESAHAKLQERVIYLGSFRRSHEQLRAIVNSTRPFSGLGADAPFEIDMAEEVRLSYESVKTVDVLDVSPEGTEIWSTAETAYNDRVARIENQVILRLRDKLAMAKSAREMFRVFSRFNTLFVRPKIRGAIQEYQTRLIDSVKEDIRRLRQKFTANYRSSEAYHMSQLRDLPSVSSAIIWARQIERQLLNYMKRVEDVLGRGWESYAEGHKLQVEGQAFREKLNSRPLYDAWVAEISRRGNLTVSGRLFDIARTRSTAQDPQGQLQLIVQFDPQVIALFKEVRALVWLGFPVPLTISHRAKDAKRVYPHAVSLIESARVYNQTMVLIDENPGVSILLANYRNSAVQMITRGMGMSWEHLANAYDGQRYAPGSTTESRESRHLVYVREFASVVSLLQDKANSAVGINSEVDAAVAELSSCDFEADTFAGLLERVQKSVDHLNLENFGNLDTWVAELNDHISKVLSARLTAAANAWSRAFTKFDIDKLPNGDAHEIEETSSESIKIDIQPLVHEIRIQNQIIKLDPPVEFAIQNWLAQLQDTLGIVCNLRRIRSSRYEISLQVEQEAVEDATFATLLPNLEPAVLRKPLGLIERKAQEVGAYVEKWLQFQALWDLEAETVYQRLGESLEDWDRLLTDIRQARSTFDTTDTRKDFGVAVIDYANAQSKVNAKYDSWQRELLSRYGLRLATAMRDTYSEVLKGRNDLESLVVEGGSTAQAVSFITFVQDLKRKVERWAPLLAQFESGQRTLERQRYSFPQDWLSVDQIQGEWGAFSELLKRKDASIKEQLAGLQLKIVAEDQVVAGRIQDFLADWDGSK